ncbi:MAG: ATP-binding protein [Proteobacteria bacterium]|nr:ATP-binding protein [Pseudomonadota bacterium]
MESINHDLQASYSVIKLLEGSNLNSERVFQSLPGVFAIINEKGEILRGNKTVANHLNCQFEDILKKPFANLFAEENWTIFSKHLNQLRNRGIDREHVEFELGIEDPDMISGERVHYWHLGTMNVSSPAEGDLTIIIGEDISLLRESEQKLNEVFSTIPLGIFTINLEGKIEDYYSSHLELLLGQKDLTGRTIGNVLFEPIMDDLTEEEQEGVVSLDFILGQGASTYDMLEPFFPKQIFFPVPHQEDKGRWLKIKYQPVIYDDTVKRLLVILEDRTEIVKTREIQKKARLLEDQSIQRVFQLKQLDAGGLHLYLKELGHLIQRLEEEQKTQVGKNKLFATTHGIKGIARVAGFTFLQAAASNLESSFQNTTDIISDNVDKRFQELFNEYAAIFSLYKAIYPEKASLFSAKETGKSNEEKDNPLGDMFSRYNSLLNAPSSLNKTFQIDQLFWGLLSYHYTFASTLEEGLQTQAAKTAKSLGKKVIIHFDWGNVLVKTSVLSALNECLIHLINNAIDHGIESPEDRIKAGKEPVGNVKIIVGEKDSVLTCDVSDDGKGLDDIKIRETAAQKGIKTTLELTEMSNSEILQLILHPGFSTAKSVTDTSGRGIGMEAVTSNLEKFRGAIHIESNKGIGTNFHLSFQLIGRDDLQFAKRCYPLSYFKKVINDYLDTIIRDHQFDIETDFEKGFEKGVYYGDLVKAIVCFSTYIGNYASKGKLLVQFSLAKDFYIRCSCKVVEPKQSQVTTPQFKTPLQLCSYFIQKDNGVLLEKDSIVDLQIPCYFHAKGAPDLFIGFTQKVDPKLAKSTFNKIKEVASELDVNVEFSGNKEKVNMLIYPSISKHRNKLLLPYPGFTVNSSKKMIQHDMLGGIERLVTLNKRKNSSQDNK